MAAAARMIAIVTFGALVAAPTFAQNAQSSDEFNLRQRAEELDKIEQQRRERAADTDRAYQKVLKSQHSDAPAPKVDPWGNIRAAAPATANPSSAK